MNTLLAFQFQPLVNTNPRETSNKLSGASGKESGTTWAECKSIETPPTLCDLDDKSESNCVDGALSIDGDTTALAVEDALVT